MFAGVTVLLTLIGIEGAGRVADRVYHFHPRLIDALDSIERQSGPTPPQPLSWPDDAVRVRVPDRDVDRNEPYVVGQRRIAGGHRVGLQGFLSPSHLADDPRRRLFIVGESAAFGFPYEMQFSFGQTLQETLGDRFVILNAGQISWSSSELVPVMARIVTSFRPDVIVLFVGNNEWQNWSALRRAPKINRHLAVIRALSHSRALAAATWSWLSWIGSRSEPAPTTVGRFKRQFEIEGYAYALANPLEDYVPMDPTALEATRAAFVDAYHRNLTEMVRIAKSRGVRVILMPTPVNYRLSPAWGHPQPESFNTATASRTHDLLHAAARSLESARYGEALETIDAAIGLDDKPAIFHYLRAEALRHLRQGLEAEQAYLASRERMVGHLGTPLSFQRVTARVAREMSADFIDVPALFDAYEHRLGGFFNEHLIADDCHPTPLGHRLIAEALIERLK
jgi:lysophospholipase L1-like esterase